MYLLLMWSIITSAAIMAWAACCKCILVGLTNKYLLFLFTSRISASVHRSLSLVHFNFSSSVYHEFIMCWPIIPSLSLPNAGTQAYVIDLLRVHDSMEVLRSVFANPRVLKVTRLFSTWESLVSSLLIRPHNSAANTFWQPPIGATWCTTNEPAAWCTKTLHLQFLISLPILYTWKWPISEQQSMDFWFQGMYW